MIFDFIQKGDLVFDVGANIGLKSKIFLEKGARVVAFEPQMECWGYLLKMDLTLENIALDSTSEGGYLVESDLNTLSSMSDEFISAVHEKRFPNVTWNKVVAVKTDTLDNMIKKHGKPKFIKIDVEGYELNVIHGLHQSIEYISVEFTPELLDRTLNCLDYLKEGVYNYGSRESSDYSFKEWVSKDTMVAFLKEIKDYEVEFGDVYVHTI
jgi:FkbM family methyltransferase